MSLMSRSILFYSILELSALFGRGGGTDAWMMILRKRSQLARSKSDFGIGIGEQERASGEGRVRCASRKDSDSIWLLLMKVKRLAIRPGGRDFSVSWVILRCTGHE